ncbi:MAG: hypothetical protein KKA07_04920 [Bacteroidetes bacterium]|nr:hypothetical protein [Bacteroidota bacterium]MBU1718394.1 hypothetical protein [Bacteroidota bacterium]
MKKITFLLILFLFGVFCISYSQGIDIQTTVVKANWKIAEKKMMISVKMKIEKPADDRVLHVLLTPLASITSLKSDGMPLDYKRPDKGGDTLELHLPEFVNNSSVTNIDLDYSLPTDSFTFGGVLMMRRENRWYPLKYDDFFSMKLTMSLPDDYLVFSTGDDLSKPPAGKMVQHIFQSDAAISIPLIVAKESLFTAHTEAIGEKTLKFYFSSSDAEVAQKIRKEIISSFAFYSEFIGKYNLSDLCMIEIPDSRVMFVQSLPGLIILGAPFVDYYRKGYSNWPAHEVAHQWWGSGLLVNSTITGRWFMEESITEYLSALYTHDAFGEDSLTRKIESYKLASQSMDKSKENAIIDIEVLNSQENGIAIYQKGALVLHALRKLIGDEEFAKLIAKFYAENYGKLVTLEDFYTTLNEFAGDSKAVEKMKFWLSEKGLPE